MSQFYTKTHHFLSPFTISFFHSQVQIILLMFNVTNDMIHEKESFNYKIVPMQKTPARRIMALHLIFETL